MAPTDSSGSGLNEPLESPFQHLTADNRGPIVLAAGIPLIIISTLTVIVKLWTRIVKTRSAGINDAVIIGANACAAGHLVCLGLAVNHGLGRHEQTLADFDLVSLSKAYYASNILLVVALACAKVSVILLVISLKPFRSILYASYGLLGFIAAWAIASVFALALQCSPHQWALGPGNGQVCVDQYAMQVSIRALDGLTDVAIVLLPVFMMQVVQVSRSQKLVVISLFALRLCTPVLSAISIVALDDFYLSSPQDRPWEAVTPAVWTIVTLNVSLVTACIPSIKRFLADWAAGLSNVNISEPFELEQTANKATTSGTYTSSSGLGSKIATRLGLSSASRAQVTTNSKGYAEETDSKFDQYTFGSRRKQMPRYDTSESVKGLTDGIIMQTIDYTVDFEEQGRSGRRDGSMGSSMGRAA